MHRVNTNKRKVLILRLTAYSLTVVFTAVTAGLLLLIAQGYRLDRTSGQVVKSGLLLVDTVNDSARVLVNNVERDANSPSRLVLSAGQYDLKLSRTGYRNWQKRVTVAASGVEWVHYPLLIPEKLVPRTLLELPEFTLFSQTPDLKHVLLQKELDHSLQVLDLDPRSPRARTLPLAATISRQNGQLGSLKVLEWAKNSRGVLLEHQLTAGKKEIISLDITRPERALNLTTQFKLAQNAQVRFAGEDANTYYALTGSSLTRLTPGSQSLAVMQNVRRYFPINDQAVAYTRRSKSQKELEVGIWQPQRDVLIHSEALPSGGDHIVYSEYDNDAYLIVGNSTSKKITVYSNPLNSPILPKQLPFTTLSVNSPERLMMSEEQEFLLAQRGAEAFVYDFEYGRKYNFKLPFSLGSSKQLTWLDNYHLLGTDNKGLNYVMDFDGANNQPLLSSQPNVPVLLGDQAEAIYRLTTKNRKLYLESADLLVN